MPGAEAYNFQAVPSPGFLYEPPKALGRWGHRATTAIIGLAACGLAVASTTERWLVAGGVLAVCVLLLWPVGAALGAYALTMPLDGILVPGTQETALSWVAGAFAGGVLLVYGLGSRRLRVPSGTAMCWGLFTLWSAASALWAMNEEFATKQLVTVIALFALFAVVSGLQFTSHEITLVSWLAIIGGVIAGALLILQGPKAETEQRATLALSGETLNPNQVANSLLIPFVLALGAFCSGRGFMRKSLPLAALTVIAAGTFLTGSRGALISLGAAILVFAFRGRQKKRLLLPLIALGLVVCFLPLSFFQRVRNAATDRGTGRLDIFLAGSQVVKHNPVFGTGLANFRVAYAQYAGFAPVFRGYDRAAHNTYLEVWGETGVIGIALLLTAVVVQLRTSARALAHRYPPDYMLIAAEAGCYGLLVYGLFGSIQWRKSFWLGWMLLAIFTRFTVAANGLKQSLVRSSPS